MSDSMCGGGTPLSVATTRCLRTVGDGEAGSTSGQRVLVVRSFAERAGDDAIGGSSSLREAVGLTSIVGELQLPELCGSDRTLGPETRSETVNLL